MNCCIKCTVSIWGFWGCLLILRFLGLSLCFVMWCFRVLSLFASDSWRNINFQILVELVFVKEQNNAIIFCYLDVNLMFMGPIKITVLIDINGLEIWGLKSLYCENCIVLNLSNWWRHLQNTWVIPQLNI